MASFEERCEKPGAVFGLVAALSAAVIENALSDRRVLPERLLAYDLEHLVN